jgi:hypothetical protein
MAANTPFGFQAFHAKIAITASGDNTVKAAEAGVSLRVVSMYFIASNTNTVTIKSDTTDLSGDMDFTSQEKMKLDRNDYGWMQTNAGEALIFTTTTDTKISGVLTYFKV